VKDNGPAFGAASTAMSARMPESETERDADGWSLPTIGLDVFWLVLGAVLIGAVVFVASVAHNSMDKVGTSTSRIHTVIRASPTVQPTTQNQVIVQVFSYTSETEANASARTLVHRGFDAQVLDSSRYWPLNRGYFVVYIGPYSDSESGLAEAKQVRAKIPGALVRDIRPR
jgi:hypothetical protein